MTTAPVPYCECREPHNFPPFGPNPRSCGMPLRYTCLKCGERVCGNCIWNLPPEALCSACHYEEEDKKH